MSTNHRVNTGQCRRSFIKAKLVAVCLIFLSIGCLNSGNHIASGEDSREKSRSAGEVTSYWPSGQWRTSNPADQDMDSEKLSKLIARIRNNVQSGVHSLSIVRNGYLVMDEYFYGRTADEPHSIQSDTKSITSLLIGIAIQQGKIKSVDDKVLSFFPEYRDIKNQDGRKSAMRLSDLMTMRSGLDWDEDRYEGSPLQKLNESTGDWVRFVLDQPMREKPGERFQYNSGGVIVLSGVIRNATGMPADTFAKNYLFDPLGISKWRWWSNPALHIPHTGGGLALRPQDMAKIGYLLLRDGRWESKQIVSQKWIRESTSRFVKSAEDLGIHKMDYGYLWWLLTLDGDDAKDSGDIITAWGFGGQWIFAVPRYDLVVVATGDLEKNHDSLAPVRFLYQDIIPACKKSGKG